MNRNRFYGYLPVVLWMALLTQPFHAFAQSDTAKHTPFVLGRVHTIESAVLKETRALNIYLPDDYATDTARYPVLYVLDGSAQEDFVHVTGIVQFLTMIEAMPKTIVVGIANIDRRRDFTFPTRNQQDKKDYPTTGGSALFIQFLEKELLPFIQQQYRTNGSGTLLGQSLGGLLATEVLLKKANLFSNYLVVSPSLWWDDESLLAQAPPLLARQKDQPVRVTIMVGKEGKQMEDDALQLSKILQAGKPHKRQVSFMHLPAEDHLTILHNAVYKALLAQYAKPVVKKK